MRWPVLVAREFITRAVADAGAPVAVADLTTAVGELEAMFADANVTGVVHCSPALLPALAHDLATRTGGGWRAPAGHLLVVDGGYRPVLGDDTLVATSGVFGWRGRSEWTHGRTPPQGRRRRRRQSPSAPGKGHHGHRHRENVGSRPCHRVPVSRRRRCCFMNTLSDPRYKSGGYCG
jgi:hypothetical protein